MATNTFDQLKRTYDNFQHPLAVVKVNGKDLAANKAGLVVSDIELDLTCGFEASIATFSLYNTFDETRSTYKINDIKAYIFLGSSVEIALGYEKNVLNVFCGFISRVNFVYEEGGIPSVRITAMDVKGIMMSNNYSKQLTATSYGEAVKEILNKTAYMNLSNSQIIKSLVISDTPDKQPGAAAGPPKATDRTIEMVAESDYEFVVKAAKKYNYEFYTEGGNVYFRPAKSNSEVVIDMGPSDGLRFFDVEYDITGLVETVHARSTDVGKAALIKAKAKSSNKISIGNKAKKLIKKTEFVYVDPTVDSQKEAQQRADALMEEISYRLGTLECDCIGMPELVPGKFFNLTALGSPPENKFYLVRVVHRMTSERGFESHLYGKAATIGGSVGGGPGGGIGL